MKLTTFLLIVFVFVARASTFAQKITLNEQQASLEKVLEKMRTQSGLDFLYNYSALDKAAPITISVKGMPLEQALQLVLTGQPLTYEISNNTVLIREKPVAATNGVISNADDITIIGAVFDEQNRAMPGATIRIKGTDKYVTANATGYFKINAPRKSILQITFIGYTTVEIEAKDNVGLVVMKQSQSALDEVQVRQYGQTTKRDATGNSVTITEKELKQSPAPNILAALAGRVPGLTITQNGSNASANYAVNIRGASSLGVAANENLNFRNQPLFILDGFPLAQGTSAPTAYGNNVTSNNAIGQGFVPASDINAQSQTSSPSTAGLSVLYSINPNDVESVTVLKDIDATAIYGSQGANGVILITTKKAKPGKMTLDGTVTYGNSYQIKKLDLMNTQQYLNMRSTAISLDSAIYGGVANTYKHNAEKFPEYFLFDRNRNVDWQKQLLGAKPNINANLGFSSGTELTSVRTSFSYFKNLENIPGAPSGLVDGYGESRATGTISLNARSQNNRLRVGSMLNFATSSGSLPTGFLESLIFLPPNAPDLFTPTGQLNFDAWRVYPAVISGNGVLQSAYPAQVRSLLKPFQNSGYSGSANLDLQYDLMQGLTLFGRGSYSMSIANNWAVSANAASKDPTETTALNRTAGFSNQKLQTWSAETGVSYFKLLGKSKISASLGSRYQVNMQDFSILSGQGYVSDLVMRSLSSAASIIGSAGGLADITQSRLLSGYLTLGYSYNSRYFLNLNGRRDGSSDYSYNSYNNFGSVSAAWIFSDEPWLKFLRAGNIFSFGKLRGSIGRAGQAITIPNLALADYTTFNIIGERYQGSLPLYIARVANSDVHSPIKNSSEFGIDLGFLNDRLTLSATHYLSRTKDMIMTIPTTAVAVGQLTLPYNFPGVVKSYGWEGSVMYRSNLNGGLTYSIGLNIANGDNILESFPGIENTIYKTIYKVGESISRTQVYQVKGINNQGIYYWDGGNINSAGTPPYVYKPTAPKYTGGMQINIGYKGLSLGTNWAFQRRQTFAGTLTQAAPGAIMQNQLVSVVANSWQKPGDEATAIYQRLTTTANDVGYGNFYAAQSNLFFKDITYLGLKNARLEYQLPASLLAKVKIARFSVFTSGDNLFYITNYKGLNPENPLSNLLIIRRTVTLGANITL